MLNEVFCYIVSKLGDFQNLRHYAPRSKVEVEALVTSEFPAVSSTKHHIKLPKTSYLSNHVVALCPTIGPTLKPWSAPRPTSR